MQLKSSIGQIKKLQPGDKIGYGLTYEATKPMTIAVIPIGYADGLSYTYSNKGKVLINGKFAPVVGTICMDQMMVDITGIDDARPGQTITIFGEDRDEFLDIIEVGDELDTYIFQFICNIMNRVPHVYFKDGMAVSYDSLV